MFLHFKSQKIHFQSDNKTFVVKNDQVWFKGYFFIGNKFYKEEDASVFLYNSHKLPDFLEIVNNCNGIFTCVIVDLNESEVAIINDRYGFGQLFYVCNDSEYFISDDYWLIQDKSSSYEIEDDGVDEILQIRYVLGERTLIKNIQEILPASVYRFKILKNNYSIERIEYWFFKYNPRIINIREAENQVFQTLDHIIKKYIELGFSESKIGMNLTGGLDSRFLLGLLLQNNISPKSVYSYTYGKKDCEDIKYAKKVSEVTGINHHEIIFDENFNDFFKSETIQGILHKIGFSTYYFQGYGISKMQNAYENMDYLLTGSDGFFIGLMANKELFAIKNKDELVEYIYKKNATILNPDDCNYILKKPSQNLKAILKKKIYDSLTVDGSDYISSYYDWTIKNRLRKYILSIYEMLNEKAIALFPFYDYEFLDCMSILPFECLDKQQAYYNAMFKYVFTGSLRNLQSIPMDNRRSFVKTEENFTVVSEKEFIVNKAIRKIFALPDRLFAFPIYGLFKKNQRLFLENKSRLFETDSEILNSDNALALINKYKRKEYFFRYGLLAIISIFRFEKLIKEKIESR
jgi:hypothetical protein